MSQKGKTQSIMRDDLYSHVILSMDSITEKHSRYNNWKIQKVQYELQLLSA